MGYKLTHLTTCKKTKQTVSRWWLTVCLVSLHVVRSVSLDNWALGCPGSGNILFQRRMSSLKKTASLRGDHELQPQSLAQSSRNSLLSLKYVAYRTRLFFLPCSNHAVRAGLWVLLVVAVTLPSQLPYPHHHLSIKHQIVYGIYKSYFLCLPEASVSGCGDKPWPVASYTCCLQNTL